jgi:hypothetical protein
LKGVAYGARKFVAVGAPLDPTVQNAPAVLTSQDGITWTHAIDVQLPKNWAGNLQTGTGTLAWPINMAPSSNHLAAVTYGAGLFAAAGDSGILAVSTNGTEWSMAPSPTTNALRSIIFAAGQFLAVGNKATILTSTDGLDWKVVDSGLPQAGLIGLTYGNGMFAAGAYDTTIRTGFVITSTNAINWQIAQSSANPNSPYYGVAYGAGQFIAVSPTTVMTSTNGVDWSELKKQTGAYPTDVFPQAVAYADGKFVIVGYGQISYSSDGEHWRNVVLPVSASTGLFGIAYGGGTFVALGQDGTILQSAPVPPPSITDFQLAAPLSTFSITGAPGLRYRIQASTNLALPGWIDLGEAALDGASAFFVEQIKTNLPQRFYRAIVE